MLQLLISLSRRSLTVVCGAYERDDLSRRQFVLTTQGCWPCIFGVVDKSLVLDGLVLLGQLGERARNLHREQVIELLLSLLD